MHLISLWSEDLLSKEDFESATLPAGLQLTEVSNHLVMNEELEVGFWRDTRKLLLFWSFFE